MKNITRHIPENAQTIEAPEADAIVYLYQNQKAQPCAIAYTGKRSKPDFWYHFQSEDRREHAVKEFVESRTIAAKQKAERKAERANYEHTYQVGDVVYFSWGYEQTNIDWFQVVAVPSKKSVVIRPIDGKLTEYTQAMAGNTVPNKDHFTGEPQTKRVQQGDYITFASYGCGGKWDGRPMYCSWYG